MELSADERLQVRTLISAKLSENAINDETLVDYVLLLVTNGKGKEALSRDLNELLDEATDDFVKWLWEVVYPADTPEGMPLARFFVWPFRGSLCTHTLWIIF